MKYAPYIAILILSLAVAYLLGGMQGQKEASLLKSSTTIKLVSTSSPTPTLSPSPYPTIQIYPTAIPTQAPKKCDFNRAQLTAYIKILGYSDDKIALFFDTFPAGKDCFAWNPNSKTEPINNNLQLQQNNLCQQQMNDYQECVNNNAKRYQDYIDCLSHNYNPAAVLCSQPSSSGCYKPSCL
jgi:hypothetical protein